MLDAGLPVLPTQSSQAAYRPPDSAAVENAKANLKMASDTIDLNVFDLKETYKYNTTAGKPTLAPTGTVRLGEGLSEPTDQKWLEAYDNLVASLPSDMKSLLSLALELPLSQRGAHIVVLDNLLQATAKALVALSIATAPFDDNEIAALHADMNLAGPYIALASSIRQDKEVLQQARNFLEEAGPNIRNFDDLVSYLGQYNAISQEIQKTAIELSDSNKNEEIIAQMRALSGEVAALSDNYDRLYGGNELQILGASLHATSLTAAALAFDNPGSGALLMSLALANIGLTDTKSELSITGHSFESVLEGLNSGFQSAFIGEGDSASKMLLSEILTSSLIGTVLFGALTHDEGLGLAKGSGSKELIAEKNFAYGLALTMLTGSGSLNELAHVGTSTLNGSNEDKEKMGDFISTTSLLFHIGAAANKNDTSSLEALIADQQGTLSAGIDSIADFVKTGLLSGNLSGDTAENFNVFLQQGSIALQEGDHAGFLDALNSSLGLVGRSNEQLFSDIGKLQDFSQSISQSLAMTEEMKLNHAGVHLAG